MEIKGNVKVNSEGRVIGGRKAAQAARDRARAIEARAAAQREDVRKAENLRKSRAIAKKAAGTGPRIAR